MFASWFYVFKCSAIPRDCNRCADFVVNKAVRGVIDIWLEDPPEDLMNVLIHDLISQ